MMRHGFEPGLSHVRFVVDKVVMGQASPEYFGSPLSVPFHQCSILIFT
jgi:hypothetical protein